MIFIIYDVSVLNGVFRDDGNNGSEDFKVDVVSILEDEGKNFITISGISKDNDKDCQVCNLDLMVNEDFLNQEIGFLCMKDCIKEITI